MHMDFQRVSANEAIRVAGGLHFTNLDKSVAGKTAGVVVTHELNDVNISCLPGDLPEHIEVALSELKPGATIPLSQVALPKGVAVPEPRLAADHPVAWRITRRALPQQAENDTAHGEMAEGGQAT